MRRYHPHLLTAAAAIALASRQHGHQAAVEIAADKRRRRQQRNLRWAARGALQLLSRG
ncbi:UNVERIFIED_ORG: hypothetical protein LHJ69_14200 [Shinella sp. XGS7]|nr:hypothetical protein [Shinella sp. XGS7]